ncbi:MAG TPA: transketolase [Candidatus Paceibacterota bacterium]|nr:transketolase [Verrucomicrobiota bacterium]HRZ45975.1 transketolase [Candidatus Paceibacterota bacterium]HRZ55296.1 transketolase [Candidatus Paceibacterota bacterium]
MTDLELQIKGIRLRRRLLETIHEAGAGHTGGGLSCLDILNVLYQRVLNVSPETIASPARDRYLQSKGHSVEALYVVLADRGFFPESDLATLGRYRSPYVGHPTRHIAGIEMNTGALGHGLPISIGMALAGAMDGTGYRVFILLGDGELAEGSNWEAAMAAAHHQLDNLTAIIDHNALQITGPTREVMNNAPLDEKWRAFGWAVRTVDGHDYAALTAVLTEPAEPRKPRCVIANTVKGKGVSFMENAARWHHGVPSAAELHQALAELEAAEARLKEIP